MRKVFKESLSLSYLNPEYVVEILRLSPHPKERGYFRETYRSQETIPPCALSPRYQGERTMGTAIYFLLTPETPSPLHRLKSDEVFHFYLGDPVIFIKLSPESGGERIIMGRNLEKGEVPQVIVPAGVWQGMYIQKGGRFALLGTTVAPGFEYEDYEEGKREELISQFPDFKEDIEKLYPEK